MNHLSSLGIAGNVYCVEMVDRDDKLFSTDYFVAFTAEGAIENAQDWLKREYPKEKDIIIGNVRRVIRNVIQ